ncbi:DUF86 domain-containing protein [Candidatus Woesearchaeota archaeon]|nr:DUF86 domain-containing protein [Candidatus Woesearchaeota archaeon]
MSKLQKSEKERILKKFDDIHTYLNELEEILPEEEEYASNLVKKRACQKTIELAIESLIDICFMVITSEKLGVVEDEEHIFNILATKKVLTPKLAIRLKSMKGFRNILVHRYGDVNDELTYDFLTHNLEDFSDFEQQILKFIANGK